MTKSGFVVVNERAACPNAANDAASQYKRLIIIEVVVSGAHYWRNSTVCPRKRRTKDGSDKNTIRINGGTIGVTTAAAPAPGACRAVASSVLWLRCCVVRAIDSVCMYV